MSLALESALTVGIGQKEGNLPMAIVGVVFKCAREEDLGWALRGKESPVDGIRAVCYRMRLTFFLSC